MMRTLGIDLGTRRVGLAMSDEGGKFASPLEVLKVTSHEDAIGPILKLIIQEQVKRVVVGLPINMDDSIGPAAKETIAWGKALSNQAAIEVVFVDERLSSFAAEQGLIERKRGGEKITRGQKKKSLDALAAADFLQAFLDHRLQRWTPSDQT